MKSVDIARDVAEGRVHGRFRVEFNKLAFNVTTTGAAIGFGTVVLGALPRGMLHITDAKGSVRFSTADIDPVAAWNGDFSVGTAPTADNVLTALSTEVNILQSTPVGPAVNRVAPAAVARRAAPDITNVTTLRDSFRFDNTAGDLELNLNFLIDAADMADTQSAIFLADGWVDVMLSVVP